MKKINYRNGETILKEKLDNGLTLYMYNTTKTKNFYITVSTHFGSEVMKYKKNNKTYNVTLGSAHFLEHRVMDFTKNKDAMEKINELGSIVNAYTTYNGTNYNIFGHTDIIKNLELLFDRVFKANIKEEDVESERGIILEEYNMYFDDPYFILHNTLNKNMFNNSFIKYPVLGSIDGIKTVTATELNRLYKDFYNPSNMFITVTGNFRIDEVLNYIKEYTKDLKDTKTKAKVIVPKEKLEIKTEYEEIKMDVNEPKIIIGYKIPVQKEDITFKNRAIIGILLSNLFSSTGDAYEELNNLGIKRNNYGIDKVDKNIYIYFKASTDKTKEFIDIIDKYMNNLSITKTDLERKKRSNISGLILNFEDIVQIEDIIATEMFNYNKILNNKEEEIKSITLKDVQTLLKKINLNTKSIVIINK